MLDGVVDVSMGIENFTPQDEAEKQFFAHLKEKLAETQKVYAAKIKAISTRWNNKNDVLNDTKEELCMIQKEDSVSYKSDVLNDTTITITNNHNQIHNQNQKLGNTHSAKESVCAATAALTQIETAAENNSLTTEIQKPYKFVPPTIAEVARYCWEKKYWIDPIAFVNFYESKGWLVGKNKMKKWKAAVVTWLGRQTREQTNKAYKMFQEKYQKGREANVR
ncbi:MAG: hypothetical protein LBJ25_06810 [Candidatus Margulisbacteria bacterium]|jgi:hypothetical protein|nr:hypothetical protein [Candidatus Margulisiibacteriota bacterium]